MADKIHTFSEEALREIQRQYWEQQRELANVKNALTRLHRTVGRHEAGQESDAAAGTKIVRYSWLPAAYGGSSATGIGGAAAISNGNTNPTNRQIFPKLWTKIHTINSSGDLEEDTTTGYLVNLGSLPLDTGWGVAVKLPDQHPHFGDLYSVIPEAPSYEGGATFTWTSESTTDEWKFTDGEADLIRGNGSSSTQGDGRGWCMPYGGDVILTHMGLWQVTFGYRGKVTNVDYPYYSLTTGAESAGTAHTHSYRVPAGFIVQAGVHRNFEPGTSTVGTNPDLGHEMRNVNANWISSEHEKTILVESDTVPWHGQHHTRLSPYIKVTIDTGAAYSGTPEFVLEKFWMTVKPARNIGTSGDVDGYFTGANQYPGGYSNGSGTFVWYGGGTEPDLIDKDGAVIP